MGFENKLISFSFTSFGGASFTFGTGMLCVFVCGGVMFVDFLIICIDECFLMFIVVGVGGDDVWCVCIGFFIVRFGGGFDFEVGLVMFFLGFGVCVFGFFVRGVVMIFILVLCVLILCLNFVVVFFEKKLGVDGFFERVFCVDGAGFEGFGFVVFVFCFVLGFVVVVMFIVVVMIFID